MANHKLSLGDILRRGHAFYMERLKKILEPEQNRKFVVIDVETEQYLVDRDADEAMSRAQEKFGKEKIFYRVEIGILKDDEKPKERKYAWYF